MNSLSLNRSPTLRGDYINRGELEIKNRINLEFKKLTPESILMIYVERK